MQPITRFRGFAACSALVTALGLLASIAGDASRAQEKRQGKQSQETREKEQSKKGKARSNTRYAVVINSKNKWRGSMAEGRAIVQSLFRKEKKYWSKNLKARVFDRPSTSPAHVAFIKDVLGSTEKGLADHWLRSKQTRGDAAPRVVKSDRLLLKMVARFDGALGFCAKTKVPKGVRVLFEY